MLKYIVPLIAVAIHRDMTTTIHTAVPEHEVPILKAIHGRDNVYPNGPNGEASLLDADAEFDRLNRKYGEDPVGNAYGTRAEGDIRRAVEDNSTGTQEDEKSGVQLEGPDSPVGGAATAIKAAEGGDAAGAPSVQWSKAQLTAYAVQRGLEVSEGATKAQLLEAIKAAE